MLYCKRIDDSHDRRAIQHSEGISLLINAVRSEYGIMITESDISYGKLGKPYLPEYPRIFFSIAHCSGLAACLVSDKVCGVDAEALRKVSAGAVKRVFSQAEEKLISSAPESDKKPTPRQTAGDLQQWVRRTFHSTGIISFPTQPFISGDFSLTDM